MSILTREKDYYSSEISLVSQSGDCSVYKMSGDYGDGIMTCYQVFPGVELIYNDFHTDDCFHNTHTCEDIMEINHCRQGRFECDFCDGSCVYLEEGDLSVNMLGVKARNSCFPLEHYHGVSVVIELPEAARSISRVLSDISIDLYDLRDRLCANNRCFIMRATDSVEHIFSELYKVPDKIKKGYFKLKVLELLLFLSVVDVSVILERRRYFQKSQVDSIKAIKEYMVSNLEYHYTLEELSVRFDIPLTAMKLCFKGVFGTSVYAFIRSYRMQAAAAMLRRSGESISSIAGKVGYVNSSKFAAAFKEVIGMSPLEYRNNTAS
ncbi:helix-turn-helix domain-containing protein [Ruminiclostridium cellobioparum]|uniref:helix-turn-helix domain-containing protein n=1 Tax=Ruminiclostridium cellobioparum TaxID=29355 RepID=UPI0004888D2B|nr:AraC family transcriptional regulator [Ruminiclostridium cellobioparum]